MPAQPALTQSLGRTLVLYLALVCFVPTSVLSAPEGTANRIPDKRTGARETARPAHARDAGRQATEEKARKNRAQQILAKQQANEKAAKAGKTQRAADDKSESGRKAAEQMQARQEASQKTKADAKAADEKKIAEKKKRAAAAAQKAKPLTGKAKKEADERLAKEQQNRYWMKLHHLMLAIEAHQTALVSNLLTKDRTLVDATGSSWQLPPGAKKSPVSNNQRVSSTGVTISLTGHTIRRPLEVAVMAGNTPAVSLLLQAGAPVRAHMRKHDKQVGGPELSVRALLAAAEECGVRYPPKNELASFREEYLMLDGDPQEQQRMRAGSSIPILKSLLNHTVAHKKDVQLALQLGHVDAMWATLRRFSGNHEGVSKMTVGRTLLHQVVGASYSFQLLVWARQLGAHPVMNYSACGLVGDDLQEQFGQLLLHVLAQPKVDPNKRDAYPSESSRESSGGSALHVAALTGQAKIARMLLQAGANPLLKDVRGANSVHLAVVSHSAATVEVLLQAVSPTRLRAQDNAGRTVLHYAALHHSVSAVNAILQRNPELVHLPDHDGTTPSQLAPLLIPGYPPHRVPVWMAAAAVSWDRDFLQLFVPARQSTVGRLDSGDPLWESYFHMNVPSVLSVSSRPPLRDLDAAGWAGFLGCEYAEPLDPREPGTGFEWQETLECFRAHRPVWIAAEAWCRVPLIRSVSCDGECAPLIGTAQGTSTFTVLSGSGSWVVAPTTLLQERSAGDVWSHPDVKHTEMVHGESTLAPRGWGARWKQHSARATFLECKSWDEAGHMVFAFGIPH